MNILALLVSSILFTGQVIAPPRTAPVTVTTMAVHTSTVPLLALALSRGSVVVETRTYL